MSLAHFFLFATSFVMVGSNSIETFEILTSFIDCQQEVHDDQKHVISNLSSNAIILGIHRENKK